MTVVDLFHVISGVALVSALIAYFTKHGWQANLLASVGFIGLTVDIWYSSSGTDIWGVIGLGVLAAILAGKAVIEAKKTRSVS